MTIQEFKARVFEVTKDGGAFKRSALNIRDGAGVLEKILGTGMYRAVLEIGTYKGVTAAYMSGFCERIITIDLRHGRLEQLMEPWDRHAMWAALGVASNIELKLVNSAAESMRYAVGVIPLNPSGWSGRRRYRAVPPSGRR